MEYRLRKKKYEYGRTQFGGLLESEEAGQEPLLPIGTHHAFLLVQKFSISKLCCEFICSFQLNFMHFLEIDGLMTLDFLLSIEMGIA